MRTTFSQVTLPPIFKSHHIQFVLIQSPATGDANAEREGEVNEEENVPYLCKEVENMQNY